MSELSVPTLGADDGCMAQITVEADAAAQTTGQYFLTPGGGVTQLPPEAGVFGKIDIVVLLAIPANEPNASPRRL